MKILKILKVRWPSITTIYPEWARFRIRKLLNICISDYSSFACVINGRHLANVFRMSMWFISYDSSHWELYRFRDALVAITYLETVPLVYQKPLSLARIKHLLRVLSDNIYEGRYMNTVEKHDVKWFWIVRH